MAKVPPHPSPPPTVPPPKTDNQLTRAIAYRIAEAEKETREIGTMLATKLAADYAALLLQHYPQEQAAISNARTILEDGLQRGIFAW